ncbi:Large cysteine-rich periplasmic protein omcB precursor [Planctomycetes bacterium CA13]|uniref:Large cysteine-rich periplasmic protein omcB n=1 Tax=Novipirellula herctigrandis TaxID=2527986 RepID=A0A5C5YXP6_9BACT|nr:Large cysteine-rich periplasmic protein omcB precursor [Planctomycetes bacterium CA13]
MKPFGVRLAAGAVTILLGALAAAQAQKDRSDDNESSWTLNASTNLSQPPTPISGIDTEMRQSFANVPPAFPAPIVAPDMGAVEQVQYIEPVEAPTPAPMEGSSGTPSLRLPGGFQDDAQVNANALTNDSASAAEAPSMAMPFAGMPTPGLPESEPNLPSSAMPSAMPGAMPSAMPGAMPSAMPGAMPSAMPGAMPSATTVPPSLAVESNPMETLPVAEVPGWGLPNNDLPNNELPNNELPNNDLPNNKIAREAPPVGYAHSEQPSNMLRGEEPLPGLEALPSPDVAVEPMPALDMNQYSVPPFEPAPQPAPQSYQALAAQPPAIPQPQAIPQPNSSIADERVASRTIQPNMVPAATIPTAAVPVAVDASETLASPGDRRLEGIQSPSIVIQKRAPAEVKVGKPASFVIHVQNVGSVEALDVQVHDRIPLGMRLVDVSPSPVQQGDLLVWALGAMPAGDERTVTLQLIPEQEGELGSVARVTFEAAASVRTVSTRPELKVVQRAPEQVLIGQQLEIEVEVSNPGTGSATGVVVQEDVPDGLEHPKGKQLDNMLGDLAPGEVRHQVLRLRAVEPGMIQNVIRLASDDGVTAEHAVNVEVVAPELQVGLSGPSRRFLERQATYQLDVGNAGTADATNVEIVAQLDRGFTFVSTDYEGQYDPTRHAVYWSLKNLPKGKNGQVPLTLLPVEEGNRKIMIEATADLGTVAKSESLVTVESLAELTFQITDSSDPIEVGGETVYEIKLANSGSRNDSNVRLQLQLPPGIERISADGDAQEDGRGGIFFPPKPELAANSDLVYRVRVRGTAPGTHVVKAIVMSDQSTVPVTKEESTMVYSDR